MSKEIEGFDKRALEVKKQITANEGKMPAPSVVTDTTTGVLSQQQVRANMLNDMKSFVKQADSLRKGGNSSRPIDLSLGAFVKEKYGFGSVGGFYDALGINPSNTTLDQLSTMPDFDEGYRWLMPEVIRDAVRLGLRRNPIYPDLIAAEETVSQMSVVLPHINMSAATPEILSETETIPVGEVSFGDRKVELHQIGTGLKISDRVQKYVSLNILSLYLQDAGIQLGLGLDTMAIDVLLNGEGNADSYAAPVIGVEATANGITYFDLLRAWLRLGRLGRMPSAMLSNEVAALNILQMAEFKGANYNNKKQNINLKTPIPQSQDYLVHGAMPVGNKLALIDKSAALIKLTSEALTVESERIAERKMSGTYATVTTGFAKLFRDAFVVIDGTLTYAANPFPTWMDVGSAESVIIK